MKSVSTRWGPKDSENPGQREFPRRGGRCIALPWACGVILFRISTLSPAMVTPKVVAVLESRTDWIGHFSVIEDTRIRMRILPDR
jgi:hypothetical protein